MINFDRTSGRKYAGKATKREIGKNSPGSDTVRDRTCLHCSVPSRTGATATACPGKEERDQPHWRCYGPNRNIWCYWWSKEASLTCIPCINVASAKSTPHIYEVMNTGALKEHYEHFKSYVPGHSKAELSQENLLIVKKKYTQTRDTKKWKNKKEGEVEYSSSFPLTY